jgi:hypothetical protein
VVEVRGFDIDLRRGVVDADVQETEGIEPLPVPTAPADITDGFGTPAVGAVLPSAAIDTIAIHLAQKPEEPGVSARDFAAPARLPAERRRIGSPVALAPYPVFSGGPFAAVSVDNAEEIRRGVRDIVSVEGPVLALRAYQLYVAASGGQRVSGEMRRVLNQLVYREIQTGALACVKDDTAGMIDRTLYLPGAPQVLVRGLGGRELTEVPKSEVRSLIAQLDLAGRSGEDINRAVLEAYGLSRLGSRVREFLEECQTYVWYL